MAVAAGRPSKDAAAEHPRKHACAGTAGECVVCRHIRRVMVHTHLVALAHVNVARSLAEHVEVVETAFSVQQLCTDR